MSREIDLIGGFYRDEPWSAQDTVNWLPVQAQAEGTRSPIKLRGVPGIVEISLNVAPGLQVISLIHFDGTAGGAGFVDDVPGVLWGRQGTNPVISSDSRFGSGAVSFSGGVGNLILIENEEFNFLGRVDPVSGLVPVDFCIECWVKIPTLTDASGHGIFSFGVSAETGVRFSVLIYPDRTLIVRDCGVSLPDGVYVARTTATVGIGSYSHIALSRQGTVLRLFVNGSLAGEGVYSAAIVPGLRAGSLILGAAENTGFNLTGLIDELRVVRESPVYTTNFTPPSGPFSLP